MHVRRPRRATDRSPAPRHADKHGFLAIPEEDEDGLLEAARFMDSNECQTVIAASSSSAGTLNEEILRRLADAALRFNENAKQKFHGQGEW